MPVFAGILFWYHFKKYPAALLYTCMPCTLMKVRYKCADQRTCNGPVLEKVWEKTVPAHSHLAKCIGRPGIHA